MSHHHELGDDLLVNWEIRQGVQQGEALYEEVKRLRAQIETLQGLSAKWRQAADSPIPTDRQIGFQSCADELDAALGVIRQADTGGTPP